MDIELNYIEKGEGEVLIFLHGNGEDLTYFKHQIDYFSKKYKVIALDTRGHGKSQRGDKPFSIRQFADDLYDFMKEKSISKANLLGFSDGGNIALIFALEYPSLVQKLIIDGANLDTSGVKSWIQIPTNIGYIITSKLSKFSKNACKKSELLRLMVIDPNIDVRDLKFIQSDTLVIAGTKDMIKKSHTELIAKNIPHGQLRFINGSHFVASENYREFNQCVADFLSK